MEQVVEHGLAIDDGGLPLVRARGLVLVDVKTPQLQQLEPLNAFNYNII